MRKALLVALAGLVIGGTGALFGLRFAVAGLYESDGFRDAVRMTIERGLTRAGADASALVLLPEIKARSWFDLDVPLITVRLGGQEHKASIAADVSLFPAIITGRVDGLLSIVLLEGGRISASGTVVLARLRGASVVLIDAFDSGSARIEDLSAPGLARLARGGAGDPRVAFTGGLLSGTIDLVPAPRASRDGASVEDDEPQVTARFTIRKARWDTAIADRETLTAEDIPVALRWRRGVATLESPIVWITPKGRAQIEGRLATDERGKVVYDLSAITTGAVPRALLASAVDCREAPLALSFKIVGPIHAPQCQ